MLKKLIVLIFCLAGVCGVFAQGKKNFNAEDAKDAEGIEHEVAVFPQLGHSNSITSLAISSDEKKILSTSRDRTIRIWDVESGRELRSIIGDKNYYHGASFSPDSKQIISYYLEKIDQWDVESGKLIRTFTPDDYFTYVWFSLDGKQIVSCDGVNIKLWNSLNGHLIRTIKGDDEISSASYSPDGKQLITCSFDEKTNKSSIKLWNLDRGRVIKKYNKNNLTTVKFSSDGKQIISKTNSSSELLLWDLKSGREINTFYFETKEPFVISPGGKHIITFSGVLRKSGNIKFYDITTGNEIWNYSGYTDAVRLVEFSNNGKYIISGTFDGTIKLLDTERGLEIRTFTGGHTDNVYSAIFSPDNKQMIYGSANLDILSQNYGTLYIWDFLKGSLMKWFYSETFNNLWAGSFNPSLKKVIFPYNKKYLHLFDAEIEDERKTFYGHSDSITSISFSSDGKQVISGSLDNSIILWDVESGSKIKTFLGHTGPIRSINFSYNDKSIISGSDDKTIRIWDVESGSIIKIFPVNSWYYSVSFSPNGKQIISCSEWGNVFKLWNAENGQEIRTFTEQSGIRSIEFSPDGKQIISGLSDWDKPFGILKLWDVESGREIQSFIGHIGFINSVSFNNNGKQIISASSDGTTRLWDVATGKEIAQFISFSGTDSQLTAASRDITFEVAEAASDISGEWIVITPDGYYNASPMGDRYLNVRVGNKVTGVDSFRHIFYNPDVVRARLQGLPDPDTKKTVTIQDVLSFFPSAITLESPSTTNTGTTNLSVNIVDDNQPIQSVKIFVNGNLVGEEELKKATGARGLKTEKASITVTGNQKTLSFNIPLTLDPGENLIEVVSFNGYAESRRNTRVTWQTAAGFNPELPNLWLLAVGVNQYNDASIKSLNYCANDAREIINSFKAQEGKRYAKVNTRLIADGTNIEPTAKNIRDNLKFLDDAGPRDIILLFLAGHGVNGKDGAFQFLPRDAVRNKDDTMSNVISGDEIAKVLETPGKRLIFIDACHSGGIDNDRMLRQLMNTNAYVFASSKGNEFSLELAELKHGVFTYSIMDTMKSQQARAGKNLSVIGLSGNVRLDVPRRTNNRQNPVGYSLGFYDFVLVE